MLVLGCTDAVLAQGGSTGGSLGKTGQELSGSVTKESAPAPDKATRSAPKREQTRDQPKDRGGCDRLIGTWGWPLGNDVTFAKGGTARASNGDGGTWSCANGVAVARWRSGFTDHLTLSRDGGQVSAVNNIGFSFTASRKQVSVRLRTAWEQAVHE
jgi:hypothetical protein